ncbi:MAG: flavodoxin family protein [Dehalococcoidales bacterium]|jgi:flavodoxin
MKALIIYDSLYGNTEKIAKAIGEGLGEEAKVIKVSEAKAADIAPYFYIIIGSPTQRGRPTAAMKTFLDSLPDDVFKGKRLAAFDTRAKSFIVKLLGWAGTRIEAAVRAKYGNIIAPPKGFFVQGTQGPLAEGEEKRAAEWGKHLATR